MLCVCMYELLEYYLLILRCQMLDDLPPPPPHLAALTGAGQDTADVSHTSFYNVC